MMSGASTEAAQNPFIVGISGDSGSGKNTVAQGVRALLGAERVATLELDDYHRFTRAEREERGLTALHPSVHNLPLVQEHLHLFRRGRPIRNRAYDHTDGTFGPQRTLEPNEVVIVRGLLGFPSDDFRAAYDLTVFLCPEPELLFRWKLRRDVKTRGYSEAQVLKHIAKHLLDSKEYVLPQAERADVVVRYFVPEWDSPDSEVRASVLLRRRAADVLRGDERLARFGGHVRLEEEADGLVLHVESGLTDDELDAWARERFPETYTPELVGQHMDAEGGITRLLPLAFAQVLIAALTEHLRRPAAEPARPESSEAAA
jgi:phosphoribulokinase